MSSPAFAGTLKWFLKQVVQHSLGAAAIQRARHHAVHLPCSRRIHDVFLRRRARSRPPVNSLTLGVLNAIDINHGLGRQFPAARKCRNRANRLLERSLFKAHTKTRQQLGLAKWKTKINRLINHLLQPNPIRQPHRRRDLRLLERTPQRDPSLVHRRRKLHAPLAKNTLATTHHHRAVVHRLILGHRDRRHPIFKCGGIDEWKKCGTQRPLAQLDEVVRHLRVVTAADMREHLTSPVIDHQHRTLQTIGGLFGELPLRVMLFVRVARPRLGTQKTVAQGSLRRPLGLGQNRGVHGEATR